MLKSENGIGPQKRYVDHRLTLDFFQWRWIVLLSKDCHFFVQLFFCKRIHQTFETWIWCMFIFWETGSAIFDSVVDVVVVAAVVIIAKTRTISYLICQSRHYLSAVLFTVCVHFFPLLLHSIYLLILRLPHFAVCAIEIQR